ncbi:ribosomal protein S5, C-terminal domain-containing protein [Elsinoe ampelina]|uniref:Small ribosomal subunit protein uS5m n=1 Tax=Elsinoe ampelina TaxID=302913 RepID=A0A6A6GMY4_9PEZI|nr:ribosomal protein S5, C-terminal domain-containing protein [Elsinoe ampelina]
MSGVASTKCLFCRLAPSVPKGSSIPPRRQFHSTPSNQARRKPNFASVRAVDLDRVKVSQALDSATNFFKPYTPREKQLLALKYTPEQVAALEAAEASINPEDIAAQGRMRDDAMRIEYKDDFSRILPLIDHPVRAPDEDIDPGIRPLTEQETAARFADWFEAVAQRQEDKVEAEDELVTETQSLLRDVKAGAELGIHPADGLTPQERLLNQSDVLADELPRLEDPRIITDNESEDPHMERLILQTGLEDEVIQNIRTKILVQHRVVNQTRMGKIQSMYFLCIAGDGEGMLGVGEGKSTEADEAARKSKLNAIRNMKPIPRYENRTIFGEVEGKVGASIVKLSARHPGFGNRCQSLIFEMARAAGLRDLSARCLRSRNKMNVVKATYAALMSQRDPEEVAMARGRKLVDVRKVYYEGMTA